jgi:ribonuclease HII
VSVIYRVGVDENGLGARLGPLVVTAVMARALPGGESFWARRPRGKLLADLDDSKRLVRHGDVALGEAWARALTGEQFAAPAELFQALSLDSSENLRSACPRHLERQCWGVDGERFEASDELRARISGHLRRLERRGVEVVAVRVKSVCTQRLNAARDAGKNRFVSDLHAMEELLLALREQVQADLSAICGKVGGMRDYERFFGPLSGRLRVCLGVSPERSSYRFVGLGEVSFVRDADARDPLVMMASLVGKYVRELLMSRVSLFHSPSRGSEAETRVSGYHDPKTRDWVLATRARRRALRVVDTCFERAKDLPS